MHVAVIGGGGTVGATTAYTLATGELAPDVTIVDVDVDAGFGHATDIRHATCHSGHPVGRARVDDRRTASVEHADPADAPLDTVDCIVVTASAPRPAGGASRGGRLTFLERNLEIARDVGERLRAVDPVPIVCVTNPMDRIAYALWSASGWPRRRLLGYSLSETARLTDWLVREFDVAPGAVECPVIGEHGEHLVPVFSRLQIDGTDRSIDDARRTAALDYIRDIPYEIIQRRGPAESSRWVTARGVSSLVESILTEPPTDPIGLSVPLEGEYGFEDVCLGVPVQLSSDGWSTIREWSLSDWERDRLDAAYRSVRESLHGDERES